MIPNTDSPLLLIYAKLSQVLVWIVLNPVVMTWKEEEQAFQSTAGMKIKCEKSFC